MYNREVMVFFARLEWHSQLINMIAGAMMGVFMIHEHLLLRTVIWKYRIPGINNALVNALLLIGIVFVVAVVIDMTRREMFVHIKMVVKNR